MKKLALILLLFLTISANTETGSNIKNNRQGTTIVRPEIAWVSIPAGSFVMGSPATEVNRGIDETQHKVTLSAFKMSRYDITFEQYDQFCNATGKEKPGNNGWGRGSRPVINVTWHDAKAFANWMGCQLPTEAQWEYACRAGTTTVFYTGNNLTTDQANYNGDNPYNHNTEGVNREKTMSVGSFAPNAWGLNDMHGNVWQWCSDCWYGDYTPGPQTDPKSAEGGAARVLRGGSWLNGAQFCRSACRLNRSPNTHYRDIGFRLVLAQ